MTAPLQAGSGESPKCALPPLDTGNAPLSCIRGWKVPLLAWRASFLTVWTEEGKAEHCFIESVQFLLLAQGGGVLIWQPEEVQQEEEAEQERHTPGATRRRGNRQDECGELLVSHLLAQLLRLPPAELATGLQALREHLPQRGEPELTQCSAQPWLSAPVHWAEPPTARPHHQRHATARGEIHSPVLCSKSFPGQLWVSGVEEKGEGGGWF